MTWIAYQLLFRLESPLHVGWRKTGNLMQTRAYVPGRIFWGAVTANLTRCLGTNEYDTIGNLVKERLRFGYFFLAEEEGKPFIPVQQKNGKINYQNLTETEFQRKFISSVASTVIAPDSFAAQEGSLHEVEFISPSPINDSPEAGRQVYLIGHLFVKPNEDIKVEEEITVQGKSLFREVISSLQIGGERRYGFGRITLCKASCKQADSKIFGYQLTLSQDTLQITVPKGKPFLSHTCVDGVSNKDELIGEVEPLVSREWAKESSQNGKSGPGHQVSKLGVCYVPGSISTSAERFRIGYFGIWNNAMNNINLQIKFVAL